MLTPKSGKPPKKTQRRSNMPSLADLYSMIDSAKRRAADTIANPGLSLAQMVNNANDRARMLNEQTAAAAQEGVDYGPASRQLANQMAEAYNPVGMTVFHGSPHLFERFDLGKIGTGDSGQAYGRGLYMAQNPEVAKTYTSAGGVKHTSSPDAYAADLVAMMGSKQKALSHLNFVMPEVGQTTFSGESRDLIQNAIKSIENGSYEKKIGNLYKVDLPDTHIRRMLDWDEPLKNQPKQVRDLAKKLGMDINDLGGDLLAKVGKDEAGKKTLEEAGIRGIKYLDQMSRDKQKGTRNFVVFDPNHLTILERNNQPIK